MRSGNLIRHFLLTDLLVIQSMSSPQYAPSPSRFKPLVNVLHTLNAFKRNVVLQHLSSSLFRITPDGEQQMGCLDDLFNSVRYDSDTILIMRTTNAIRYRRQSISSSVLLMSYLGQLLPFVARDIQQRKSPGQRSGSIRMIGNVSTTSTSLSATLTSSNTIFLTRKSQVSGAQFPHLKNFKWHGKRNVILQDSGLITLLSTRD